MTAGELTHGFQQLVNQASLDQTWFARVVTELNDHAERLDATAIKMVGALGDIKAIRGDARQAFDKIEQNDLDIKSAVDHHISDIRTTINDTQQQADTSLRAHVQQELRNLHEIVQALGDGGASTRASDGGHVEGLITQLNMRVQQTEAHMVTLQREAASRCDDNKREIQGLGVAVRNHEGMIGTHDQALAAHEQQLQHQEQGMADLSQRTHVSSACAAATAAGFAQQAAAQAPAPSMAPAAADTHRSEYPPSVAGTQVPAFPPTRGQPTTYRQDSYPTTHRSASEPFSAGGSLPQQHAAPPPASFLTQEGGYRGYAPPQGFQEQAGGQPQYHSMSPGNDHNHHRGKRVVFDRKVAHNPAYLYDKDKVEK